MKIALIIYGHMRTYRNTFASVKKNIIDVLNPDIFIHTWDEIESRTMSWHNDHMKVCLLDEDHRNRINDFYCPLNIVIETQNLRLDSHIATPNSKISSEGQRFMLYSFKKANQLKRNYEKANNFEYELVIKIRPDIVFFENLPIPDIIKDGDFYIGSREKKAACDIINFSKSSVMDKASTVIDFFDEFYVEKVKKQELSHTSYIDFIDFIGLNINYINYYYDKHWIISRDRGGNE